MSGDDAKINVTSLTADITRIETVEDGKLHGYHVIDGITGPMVVDPGFADAPETVYAPVLAQQGASLADVDAALITHADADHFGGNHVLRAASPGVTLACHAADARWIESVDRAMAERYRGFEGDHAVGYDDDILDWLRSIMGPDEPVDWYLTGGETLNVANSSLEVLHTPGHSPGHLMLYDRGENVLIGADGFFGRGLVDVDGEPIQPPPYFDRAAYLRTIDLVDALSPDVLSFTHYDLLKGDAIASFIDASRDFVSTFDTHTRALVAEYGSISLATAIEATADRLGTYGFETDLAIPLSAHFDHLVETGEAMRAERDGQVVWRDTS